MERTPFLTTQPWTIPLQDVELKARPLDTGSELWHGLFEREADMVFLFIRYFGVDRPDAEDLTQEVFLIAYRQRHALDEVDAPAAWLRRVALRVVGHHFRWRKVRRAKQALVEALYGIDGAGEPAADVVAAEEHRRVHQTLARMSPKTRNVLVLTELAQLPISEVAASLGIPLNTVRSRRALARKEFARLWQHTAIRGSTRGASGGEQVVFSRRSERARSANE